jgi:hypothetical protein
MKVDYKGEIVRADGDEGLFGVKVQNDVITLNKKEIISVR